MIKKIIMKTDAAFGKDQSVEIGGSLLWIMG